MHLWNLKLFLGLCEGFEKFYKAEEMIGPSHSSPTIRMLVNDCDLLKVPHILPLLDEGIKFPVIITLDRSLETIPKLY